MTAFILTRHTAPESDTLATSEFRMSVHEMSSGSQWPEMTASGRHGSSVRGRKQGTSAWCSVVLQVRRIPMEPLDTEVEFPNAVASPGCVGYHESGKGGKLLPRAVPHCRGGW